MKKIMLILSSIFLLIFGGLKVMNLFYHDILLDAHEEELERKRAALSLVESPLSSKFRCPLWDREQPYINAIDNELWELSGLAKSKNPGNRYYAINDSANDALLYVLNQNFRIIQKILLPKTTIDSESLAVGPCPDSESCVFIGDTGDNFRLRDKKSIIYIKEKDLNTPPYEFKKLSFRYPNNGKMDAEALVVHPISGNIYIATKVVKSQKAYIYKIKSPQIQTNSEQPVIAELTTRLPVSVTGMDISQDGDSFISVGKRMYEFALNLDDAIPNAHYVYGKHYRMIPSPEIATIESVAWVDNENRIVTGSESIFPYFKRRDKPATLRFMSCKPTPPPPSQHIYIYIEADSIQTPFPFIHKKEGGKSFLQVAKGSYKNHSSNRDSNSLKYSFVIHKPGLYYVFALINSSNEDNNSFYYKLNNQKNWEEWETIFIPGWKYSRLNIQNGSRDKAFNLKPGTHTLTLKAREQLLSFQELVITTNPFFHPDLDR